MMSRNISKDKNLVYIAINCLGVITIAVTFERMLHDIEKKFSS